MERYIIVLLVMFVLKGPLHAQTPSTTIAFEERVHDFGTILEANGKVSHTFIFHNNGKTPAAINDIYSGCGCIGKTLSKASVGPGGKGKVTIVFNPDYKSGFFSKEIIVFSNNRQNFNRIWVQGVIKPCEHPIEEDYPYDFGKGLYLRLKVMAFGFVKPGETKQMELHYANVTNKEMTLNFVVEGNKGALRFTSPGKIGPKARGVIDFSYTMSYLSNRNVVFELHPYVNGRKLAEVLEIKILRDNTLKQKAIY